MLANGVMRMPTPIRDAKTFSIRATTMKIIMVTVPIMVISVAVSLALILLVQKQAAEQLRDVAGIHAELIESQMASLRYYMSWSISQDESIQELVQHKDMGRIMTAARNTHERFMMLQQNYSPDYQFFLYSMDTGLYMNCGVIKMNYKSYRNLKSQVIAYIENNARGLNAFSRYITLQDEQSGYITAITPYGKAYLICMIAAIDIIKPLENVNIGREGYVYLKGEDGLILANSGSSQHIGASSGLFAEMTYERSLLDKQYSLYVVADKFGTFETAVAAQLVIGLMLLLIIGVMLAMIFYLRNRVIQPIRRFSDNLASITRDGVVEMRDTKILELQQAGQVFRGLMDQIRKLKIDIYEREQERQRIQLEYMQLQIKPHFYLNSLSSIHSMAQLQMFDAISSMAQSTSQYLRYLFKNSQEWVLLKHEVDHVRNYLDIHVIRYGDALTYAIELDQAAADVQVPPLVLQPFVENTIRHALTLDEPIHISISAACKPEDGEWVIMEVRDNGKGFPAEQLAILQSGQIPEENGRHIGIRNTVQRLRLKYEGNMTIRFYNDPDTGGACIWLQIPRRIKNTPQETTQNHL